MTLAFDQSYGTEIEPVLDSLGVHWVLVKPGHWLIDGAIVLRTSYGAEDWLVVESSPAAGSFRRSPWVLARTNRQLRWPARVALGSGDREQVRADLSLGEANGHLAGRLKSACDAVRSGCEQIKQGETALSDVTDEAVPGAREVDLAALCAEAGWQFKDRDDGRIVVTLDVPNEFVQAVIEPSAGGARVYVEVLRTETLAPECRDAIGLLLLTVSRAVRSVRPSASDEADGDVAAWLEVELEDAPTPAMLDRALACLSLSAAHCTQEIGALVDSRLAKAYLAAQGRRFPDVS